MNEHRSEARSDHDTHIKAAREYNLHAAHYITRHIGGPNNAAPDTDKVTMRDVTLALLRTIQALDALIQAVADPEAARDANMDRLNAYEEGFGEGVKAGGGQ
jgi:hypothetical protein